MGKSETAETFAVETYTNYSSPDYNGFRPNEGADFSFEWMNFLSVSEATGQDRHSVIVDYDVFQKVTPPDPNDPRILYKAADFDFQPDPGAYEVGQPVPHYGPRE